LELQIANPQILRIIPLLQIRKFLRSARPQIANPQFFMINPQITNLQFTNVCHSANGKSANFHHRTEMMNRSAPFWPFHGKTTLKSAAGLCDRNIL
jgi:hypothetical protein